MYLCNFNYKCVRIHTFDCAFHCVLAFSVLLIIFSARHIENRNIARMASDRHHRQRRPLRNG